MEEEITLPPARLAQFDTLEAYALQNDLIVAYEDQHTGGQFSKTGTLHYYTPEPEPVAGKYFMPASGEHQAAGLFDGCTLVDSLPNDTPTLDWLKADIQAWLTAHGIDFNTSDTKQQLIDRVQ